MCNLGLRQRIEICAKHPQLQQAYSVLCDPEQRTIYDLHYAVIRERQTKATETNKPSTQTGSRSTAEANQTQNSTSLWQKSLQELNIKKKSKDGSLFEELREVTKLKAELSSIQEAADRDAKEEAASAGWTAYFTSFITKEVIDVEEENAKREIRKLDRMAARRIKEHVLKRYEAVVGRLRDDLQKIEADINRIRNNIIREKQEAVEREMRQKQAQAHERFLAEQERLRKERDTMRAAWEAEILKRRSNDAVREAERLARQQAETMRSQREAKSQRETRSQRETKSQNKGPCDHRVYWRQVEGSQTCSQCMTTTRRFAFECPRCQKVACASCRNILKGVASRNQHRGQRS